MRRSAIAQNFNALDGRSRYGGKVGAHRSPVDRAIHIHQSALVAAFSVDEHQHLIGAEAAQLCRI